MKKTASIDQSLLKESQSRRFYALRIVGCIFGFLPISVTFYHLNVPVFYWFYVVFGCFMWPHIAYYTSIHSRDSNKADLRHCLIETFLAGILIPMMSFNLLPGITLFGMFSMNNIGFSGLKFFLKGTVCFLAGMLVVIPLTGTPVIIDTSTPLVLSCIPALIFYPLVVSFMAYDLARNLNKTRETLKRQNKKLESANIKIKEQRDLLDNLSRIDDLTGIPNRRQFDEYLEKQWQNTLRSNSVLSLIMIDIDHFKEYNDNYGHAKGDECLKKVSNALSNTIKRPNDMLARYGGDEFVCVLPLTDLEGARNIAEQMRKNVLSLAVPHFHSTVADYVTISLGTATIKPDRHRSTATLFKAADKALYKAKHKSRNRAEY